MKNICPTFSIKNEWDVNGAEHGFDLKKCGQDFPNKSLLGGTRTGTYTFFSNSFWGKTSIQADSD